MIHEIGKCLLGTVFPFLFTSHCPVPNNFLYTCASQNSMLHSTHDTIMLPIMVNCVSLPCLWNNNSQWRSYFHFPGVFPAWGKTFFSENGSVVWRVNWPLVRGHAAGIWMLSHCGTYVNGNKWEDRRGSTQPGDLKKKSQGRWGHPCLISK